jgi:hypothetical protein
MARHGTARHGTARHGTDCESLVEVVAAIQTAGALTSWVDDGIRGPAGNQVLLGFTLPLQNVAAIPHCVEEMVWVCASHRADQDDLFHPGLFCCINLQLLAQPINLRAAHWHNGSNTFLDQDQAGRDAEGAQQ